MRRFQQTYDSWRAALQLMALASSLALLCGCDASTPPAPTNLFDAGSPDLGPCEAIDVTATRAAPSVMIVLDRSGSMYSPPVDRWTPAFEAIDDLLTDHQGDAAFGLMLFGSDNLCAAGRVRVAPSSTSAENIRWNLTGDPAERTGGGTPTATSLARLRSYLSVVPGDRYAILITDGAPNCNAVQGERETCTCTFVDCDNTPSPWLGCLDEPGAVSEIRQLAQMGVPTWVIGYDTSEFATTLDAMAAAGDTGRETYIPVGDRETLSAALSGIAGELISCSFRLQAPPGDPSYVRVTLDGVPIPHESQLGEGAESSVGTFVIEDGTTVRLLGPACETLQDGAPHPLLIARECEPIYFG